MLHILLGLIGLSFIVLIHELGHFFAARLCKIKVERLCLFLGKPLISRNWGGTEFGIAWLPLGGYCKMKDEGLAVQDLHRTDIPENKLDEGSFQAASPLQRIFVAAAGPFINIVFAFLVLFLFQAFGYPELRDSNKIVVTDAEALRDIEVPQNPSPAELAGLESGDVILRVGDTEIESFQDLRLAVALRASETLPIEFRRSGKVQQSMVTLARNSEGRGWLGVNPWQDLLLVEAEAGLPVASRLTAINGIAVANLSQLAEFLQNTEDEVFRVRFASEGNNRELDLSQTELFRLRFGRRETWSEPKPLFSAFVATFMRLRNLLRMQWQGLKKIVQGRLSLKDNIAGPIRISDQIGQVMLGSGASFAVRWYNSWQFLSFISFMIALANLLPLAVLDGGQILLFLCELLAGGRLPAKWIRVYQFVGSVVVMGLMFGVLALEFWHYIVA